MVIMLEVCYGYYDLWYPLFQAQWDICDQQNHQTWNYFVKGHHLTAVSVTWLTATEYLRHK
jgi:hypothetical protein